jgi:hypothetical protein
MHVGPAIAVTDLQRAGSSTRTSSDSQVNRHPAGG